MEQKLSGMHLLEAYLKIQAQTFMHFIQNVTDKQTPFHRLYSKNSVNKCHVLVPVGFDHICFELMEAPQGKKYMKC